MPDRVTIWEANGQRLMLEKTEDGVHLLHSTDFDSGPTRSVPIPAEAIIRTMGALSAFLYAEGNMEAVRDFVGMMNGLRSN